MSPVGCGGWEKPQEAAGTWRLQSCGAGQGPLGPARGQLHREAPRVLAQGCFSARRTCPWGAPAPDGRPHVSSRRGGWQCPCPSPQSLGGRGRAPPPCGAVVGRLRGDGPGPGGAAAAGAQGSAGGSSSRVWSRALPPWAGACRGEKSRLRAASALGPLGAQRTGSAAAASSALGPRCRPRPGAALSGDRLRGGVSQHAPRAPSQTRRGAPCPVPLASLCPSPPRRGVRVAGSARASLGAPRAAPSRTFPVRTLDEAVSGLVVGPQSPAFLFPKSSFCYLGHWVSRGPRGLSDSIVPAATLRPFGACESPAGPGERRGRGVARGK